MPIPVFRVEKNANYTTMSNYHLRDNTISFKAKGLLSMFLSLPKDWSYSVKGIATISKEGVDGILSGLKELEAAGYLERHRMRNDKGRLGDSEYVIYEMPHRIRGSPELEKPNQEKPVQANPVQITPEQEKPVEENPAQLNIEVINKDAYLETVGFKIVHYWGFALGNRVLPMLVPGFFPDICFAAQYAHMVSRDTDLPMRVFS